MEVLVVDSSVVVKWVVAEHDTAAAQAILRKCQSNQLLLTAPDLLLVEIANVCWKKQQRKLISPAEAAEALEKVRALGIVLERNETLLERALQLAIAYDRTVYDMLYLAHALREQCAFVTADTRLANALGEDFPQVTDLSKWS